MNWVDDYVHYTSSQESPEIFHRWGAIAAIAGVVSRNVVLLGRRNQYGVEFFRTWPGLISVVLVAGAGRCKSLTAANLVSEVFSESVELLTSTTAKSPPNNCFTKWQVCKYRISTIVAEELFTFLTKTSYNDGLVDIPQ